MDKRAKVFIIAITLTTVADVSDGHGRMMEPPARNTMWRFGFNTIPNYEDSQMFCGGIKVQWEDNKGECGICGDPYNGPRIYETGGLMAKNITTRNYPPGSEIDVIIELIANHAGKFTFQMCWRNSTEVIETEQCFENLTIKNGSKEFILTGKEPLGRFSIPVQLPINRTCDFCILRWDWRTSNNWGHCHDGSEKIGCGPQETYRNCADIYVGHELGVRGPPSARNSPKLPFISLLHERCKIKKENNTHVQCSLFSERLQ